MDRQLFSASTAIPLRLERLVNLIAQNRFLQPLQKSFGLIEAQTKTLRSSILMRATDLSHIVRPHFTVFKHRLNKNPDIHDGPRLVPKTSTYHIDHQLLPTP